MSIFRPPRLESGATVTKMAPEGDKPNAERGQTDESLRTEREKTDRALAEKHAELEREADNVIQRARETADAAGRLQSLANSLKGSVSHFKV